MAVLNIGSINWDRVYRVARFPLPGETMTSVSASVGLGGKGLNQSVSLLRSGAQVTHFGAVGAADAAMIAALSGLGLATGAIQRLDGVETGSALILVDQAAENCIVLDPGANRRLPEPAIRGAVSAMAGGDWLVLQNETNGLELAASLARARGMRVALAAAPFDAAAVIPLLPLIDLLSVNEIEFAQLREALGGAELPHGLALLVSRGAQGAGYRAGPVQIDLPAFRVTPVDTTGAGDTAFGAFLARLDCGDAPEQALRFAMAAAALQVTRPGAADAIPDQAEVLAFLAEKG